MIPFFAIYAFIGVVVFFCLPRGVPRRGWTGFWLVLFAYMLYEIGILTGEARPINIPLEVKSDDVMFYVFEYNMISLAIALILGGGPALLLVFCVRGVRRLARLAMGKESSIRPAERPGR
jgi:hypothetical protein